MKFKSNRKRRSTRKTRQCKRIKNRRTRRQRGGLTMNEIYDNTYRQTLDAYKKQELPLGIPYEKLLQLIEARNELPSTRSIKDTVMSTLTVEDIRTMEFVNANKIISQEIPLLIVIKPIVREVLPKIVLDLRRAFQSELAFNQQFATSKAAAAAAEAKAASSGAASSGAASIRASSSGASSSGAETEKARRKQMIATLDKKLALVSNYGGTPIQRPKFEALYDVSVGAFDRTYQRYKAEYETMFKKLFDE